MIFHAQNIRFFVQFPIFDDISTVLPIDLMSLLSKPAFTIIKSLTLFQAEKKSICFTNSKENSVQGPNQEFSHGDLHAYIGCISIVFFMAPKFLSFARFIQDN